MWLIIRLCSIIKRRRIRQCHTVLRIRDVYPGSRIPDLIFFIPDKGSKDKKPLDTDPQRCVSQMLSI
jgi:hypothetical protein